MQNATLMEHNLFICYSCLVLHVIYSVTIGFPVFMLCIYYKIYIPPPPKMHVKTWSKPITCLPLPWYNLVICICTDGFMSYAHIAQAR